MSIAFIGQTMPTCIHNMPTCRHTIPTCMHNIPTCVHNMPICRHTIPTCRQYANMQHACTACQHAGTICQHAYTTCQHAGTLYQGAGTICQHATCTNNYRCVLAVCQHAYTYANVRYAVQHAVMHAQHACATCMREVLARHTASLHPPSAYHRACVFRSTCQNAMSFGCVSAVMSYV